MDIKNEARKIIKDHTEGYMSAVHYEPENNFELWDTMVSECSWILTEAFLDGEYTPMEYNELRNEIAEVLNKIFSPICYKESKHDMDRKRSA